MRTGLAWIALALAVAACGNKGNTCVEGASVACACPTGGSGAQVCTAGAYGACTCANAAPVQVPATPDPTPVTPAAPAPIAPAPAAPTPIPATPIPVAPVTPLPDDHERGHDHDRDKDLREARERYEKLNREVLDATRKLDEAMHQIKEAKSEADRRAVKARIEPLAKEKAEAQARAAEAKTALDRLEKDDHDHHR